MLEEKHYKPYWRWLIQAGFLVVFSAGFILGTPQRWLVVFLAGIILAKIFGRFYCSLACPMNTLFQPIAWLYRRFGWQRYPTPEWLKRSWVRWGVLAAFLLTMVVSQRTASPLNLLGLALVLAIGVTLVQEEATWHRYLCPYGTLLSLPAAKAKWHRVLNEENCVACGLCQKACPSGAILTRSCGKRFLESAHCLECGRCQQVCPTNAIAYRS